VKYYLLRLVGSLCEIGILLCVLLYVYLDNIEAASWAGVTGLLAFLHFCRWESTMRESDAWEERYRHQRCPHDLLEGQK